MMRFLPTARVNFRSRAGLAIACLLAVCGTLTAEPDLALERDNEDGDEVAVLRLDVAEADQALTAGPTHDADLMLHIRIHTPSQIVRHRQTQVELCVAMNGRPAWKFVVDAPGEWVTPALPLAIGPNRITVRVDNAVGTEAELEFFKSRTIPSGAVPSAETLPDHAVLRGDFTVDHDWIIPTGRTVILAAGTALRFAPGVGLVCHGRLVARGTIEEPVWLLAADPKRPWSNVVIHGETASANLEHARLIGGGGRANSWVNGRTQPEFGASGPAGEPRGTDGGALMVVSASATQPTRLSHVIVANNHAVTVGKAFGMGGAVFVEHSHVVLRASRFIANRAGADGGGIYVCQGGRLTAEQCQFQANHAARDGGAVALLMNTAADFSDCTFIANVGARNGGGVNLNLESRALFSRCEFVGNAAGKAGAGVLALQNMQGQFDHCVFNHNRAGFEGGGGYFSDLASIELRRSTFTNNTAGATGGGLAILNCAPTVIQCEVQANRAEMEAGAGGVAVRYGRLSSGAVYNGAKLSTTALTQHNTIRNNQPRDWYVHGAE